MARPTRPVREAVEEALLVTPALTSTQLLATVQSATKADIQRELDTLLDEGRIGCMSVVNARRMYTLYYWKDAEEFLIRRFPVPARQVSVPA